MNLSEIEMDAEGLTKFISGMVVKEMKDGRFEEGRILSCNVVKSSGGTKMTIAVLLGDDSSLAAARDPGEKFDSATGELLDD